MDTDRIERAVEDLGRMQSVSSFSLLTYRLILRRLADRALGGPTLRRHFADLVGWEVRYHTALGNLAADQGVSVTDIGDLADRRHAGLCRIIDRLAEVKGLQREVEATRQLILAECFYQTVMHDRVVGCLEAAIEAGADEPLVCFALGYNRYVVAEQSFTATDASTGDHIVTDARGYRQALLEAVTALENGLSGGELDRQLYWWIGTCLERAGFANAARKAFAEAEVGAESHDLAETDAADDAELEMVRQALRGPLRAGDILGDGAP